VDWNQATAYCEWLGGRLPSEAEWEYAARSGGVVTNYPWGDEEASCDYAVMNDEFPNTDSTFWGCYTGNTFPVCSKPTGNTEHGLCDMSGNIMEWNADDHHNTYEGAPTDGSAWIGPPSTKVIRGGSYYSGSDAARTTWRSASVYDGYAMPMVGFRCARDAE
jgi:formylglycine-generating enzyme required for sulfatase activity